MDTRLYWGCIVLLCAGSSTLHAQTSIYRCTINGIATFTDQPCGEHAKPVELDSSRVSTFTPVPAGKVDVPKSPRRKARATGAEGKKKERCVSIRSALRKIDDQFRSGYSAKQGVRLEDRKRDLRRQARELGC
ncbi:MAG: hypothetical protein ABW110_23660 [Steroidobacteraceae bacterium]